MSVDHIIVQNTCSILPLEADNSETTYEFEVEGHILPFGFVCVALFLQCL